MPIDWSGLEKLWGTANVLRACKEYIRNHKREQSALRGVERGKAPKGSSRKSTYLKTRRECDRAFARMIKREYGNVCYLHQVAEQSGVELPVKCNHKLVCFHLVPKVKSDALRFDKENAIQACSGANLHESLHRGDWERIFDKLFPDVMDSLWLKHKMPHPKRNEANLRQMIAQFDRS